MIELKKYTDNGVYVLYWDFRKKTKKYGYNITQMQDGMAYGKDATELYKTVADGLIQAVQRYRQRKKWTITRNHPEWWLRSYLRDIYFHKLMLKWIKDNESRLDEIAKPATRQSEYTYIN